MLVYYVVFVAVDCALMWCDYLYELSVHALLVFIIRDFPLDVAHGMWPPESPWWAQIVGQLQVRYCVQPFAWTA